MSVYCCWGAGEGNGTCHLFCSWRSLPKIPAPPAHTEISQQISLAYPLTAFQTAASMLYLIVTLYCAVSLRAGTSFLLPFHLAQSQAHWCLKFHLWVAQLVTVWLLVSAQVMIPGSWDYWALCQAPIRDESALLEQTQAVWSLLEFSLSPFAPLACLYSLALKKY